MADRDELRALAERREPRLAELGPYLFISGRRHKRVVLGPVRGAMCRCIQCGQIDEEPWHDNELCQATLAAALLAFAEQVPA